MRYQIRGTGSPDAFMLYDLKKGEVAMVGSWEAIKQASQDKNLEDMAAEARSRIPHMPMPLKGSVASVRRH